MTSLVTACTPGEVERGEAAARAPERAPEVLFAGCESVTVGPVCRLRPGAALRLWLAVHRETPLVTRQDGRPLAASWTPAEDGLRAELRPEAGLVTVAAADAGWRWSLKVEPAEEMPEALAAVDARAQAGEQAEALALLTARLPGLEGAARAEGLKLRGDLEFMRGELSAALTAYAPAFEAALAEGLLGRASEIALIASFICAARTHDYAQARGWLARHASLTDRLPEARLRHGYYAGLVADRTGDYNAAIGLYREHARLARALGQAHDVAAALSALGVLLGRLGDLAGAEAAFAEALALGDQVPARARVLVLQNAAWVAIEARARGHEAPDPEPRLAEVLAFFGEGSVHADLSIAADTRLNLAYAAILRGDAEAAAAALGQVVASDRRTERWRLYLEARIDALAGRHRAALGRFSALAARAREDDDRGLEWSAEIGAGEALVAGGRAEAAVARFRRAALLHRADVGALALELGRERFAAARDGGAKRLVALLLQLGQVEEAMCAARQARVHAFADLAAMTRDPAALAAHREARSALEAAFERTWELPRLRGEVERARLRAERRELDGRLDRTLRGYMSGGTGDGSGGDRAEGTGAGLGDDRAEGTGDGSGGGRTEGTGAWPRGDMAEGTGDGAGGDRAEGTGAGLGGDRAEGTGSWSGGDQAEGTGAGPRGDMAEGTGAAGARPGASGVEGLAIGSMSAGCGGLREPAPGELLLVYYPLDGGQVGFAVDRVGVIAAELPGELPEAPAARGELLLGPFDAAIARARQVSIAASGRLGAEAFHALPWREGPLVAARPVAYALDLPSAPGRPEGLRRALQLAPPSNLAHAEEEVAAVAQILGARQVAVTRLRGSERSLQAELASADLLHFVGHAHSEGWGGALDLGGDRSLSAGFLLAGRAPRIAVLSGCETGLHDPQAHAGGMSLAHALLLAGATAVVAADAKIADDLAAALVPAAITAIADGDDAATALRAAQEQLRGTRDDWARFRVFVR